jgi:hypothetical protein
VRHIEAAWNIVRRSGSKYGPYLLLEAVMPGGTLLALALYLYRSRRVVRID